MYARWTTFAVGLALMAAPLVVGYGPPGVVLHHVAVGLLVCIATLPSLEWPPARFAQLAPALWLAWSARTTGAGDAAAVELGVAAALAALAVVPSARLAPQGSRAGARA